MEGRKLRRTHVIEWVLFADLFSALTMIFFTVMIGSLPFYLGVTNDCELHSQSLNEKILAWLDSKHDSTSDNNVVKNDVFEIYGAATSERVLNLRVKNLVYAAGESAIFHADYRGLETKAMRDFDELCSVGIEFMQKLDREYYVLAQIVGRTSPDFKLDTDLITQARETLISIGQRKQSNILLTALANLETLKPAQIVKECALDNNEFSFPLVKTVCKEARHQGNRDIAIHRVQNVVKKANTCRRLPIGAVTHQQLSIEDLVAQVKDNGPSTQADALPSQDDQTNGNQPPSDPTDQTVTLQLQPASCL